jgi:HEPN/Toprim N-terminal domain 1
MGTYSTFSIADYPLIEYKSGVFPIVMTLFRETDKKVFERRLADRNRLVWGDAFLTTVEEVEIVHAYVCSIDAAIDRLEVMGFTLARAQKDYESGRRDIIAQYREWIEEEPDTWFEEKLKVLESLSFETYLLALKEVVDKGLQRDPFDDINIPGLSEAVRYLLAENDEFLMGFFAPDIRCLIRALCHVAQKSGEVVQDITDLVDGGYYEGDEPVCQNAIDSLVLGHLENSNRIVLTEGSTDARVLKRSLRLLYPHLADYYSFMDFDNARVPGSAGHLVTLVKSFAASGIGNRIIAIFDNDTAASDARRSLDKVKLPPNFAVLAYPEVDFLRQYPTIGPSGNTNLDVNGLAASIELYFGEDVLRRTDGTLAPVQWKGYIEGEKKYQGEVVDKAKLITAFDKKLERAERDTNILKQEDWSGIKAILRVIFDAFRG